MLVLLVQTVQRVQLERPIRVQRAQLARRERLAITLDLPVPIVLLVIRDQQAPALLETLVRRALQALLVRLVVLVQPEQRVQSATPSSFRPPLTRTLKVRCGTREAILVSEYLQYPTVSRWCPFRWRRPNRKFTFGVAGDFIDFVEKLDDEAERAYNLKYDTCWKRFVHFLKS